jgi:fumarate reductase flavoprotein subunit
MGGIRTDHRGESPTLKGLFACGEVACWDLHGFNRLGGNSVAETVVAGMLVSQYIADFCESTSGGLSVSTRLAEAFMDQQQQMLDRFHATRGDESPVKIRKQMEKIMMDKVGLFRNGDDLASAVTELTELLQRSQNLGVCCQHPAANPELVLAYRLPRMLKIALAVAMGALARSESRGAHFREDHPERNDRDWLNRTLYQWIKPADLQPTLSYEALDINNMELPPGFRGYGAKNIVEHRDSAHRQAAVDAIADGADNRFAAQQGKMPFRYLLPEKYRHNNERLAEPLHEIES